ncbi:MAG: ABC transporter ATP-binding protein [Candidatus Eisenbacteria bacterium]|uniref:ABC transporter ATP-binding protein n=1 Tax=Eiseniibacteriota bacterium TaxID=2212470 RepID=A0A849SNW6_UNCEI|nr:ABC transporter ATP-binding protein [Candidatus Eisenbacteria bacterium]
MLEVVGLGKTFTSKRIFAAATQVCAARDVSFRIDRGEAVALVGESGSGKSTIARILLRLETADRGEIRILGEDVLAAEPHRATLAYRGRVQMVFQDPFGSLNPVHSVGHHLERPLVRHGSLNPLHSVAHHLERPLVRHGERLRGSSLHSKVLELLKTVGLDPPEEFVNRYPHELSGGQRQRVAIARALAVEPDILVADEPTSMLDVSIRMGILNLLARLKQARGLAILLITHDLASARYLADRILVLYRGRLVENGPSEQLVDSPAHPYTRALLASIAETSPKLVATGAAQPAPAGPSGLGCPFAARCPDRMEVCSTSDPEPRTLGDRAVRCHLYPPTPLPVRS